MPMSSIFKRMGRKEREDEGVHGWESVTNSPSPSMKKKSAELAHHTVESLVEREDTKLSHAGDEVELFLTSDLVSEDASGMAKRKKVNRQQSKMITNVTRVTNESRYPEHNDTRRIKLNGRRGIETIENRSPVPFERISRRSPFNRRQTRRGRSPSPWGTKPNDSLEYLPELLAENEISKKESETKVKGQKGLTIVEPNIKSKNYVSTESNPSKKETMKSISRSLNGPNNLKEKERKSQRTSTDPCIVGDMGKVAESLLDHEKMLCTSSVEEDESTGLKIVVYDNEEKSERKVRVTILDTGEALHIKGENIEQFLKAIFREAINKNQNIQIENGNVTDHSDIQESSSEILAAVSFIKTIDSKNSGRVGIPCDTGPVKNTMNAVDKGSSSPVYFKRVRSLNKDVGSIAHTSIGRARKNVPEKQNGTMDMDNPFSSPNNDYISDKNNKQQSLMTGNKLNPHRTCFANEDNECSGESIGNIIEALIRVKSAMGKAQCIRSNSSCDSSKGKPSTATLKTGHEMARPLCSVVTPIHKEDGSLEAGKPAVESSTASVDAFVKFALERSSTFAEQIGMLTMISSVSTTQAISSLGAGVKKSVGETIVALNKMKTVAADDEAVEISQPSAGQAVSTNRNDQYLEKKAQVSSDISIPITSDRSGHGMLEPPPLSGNTSRTTVNIVSTASLPKEECPESEIHLDKLKVERHMADKEKPSVEDPVRQKNIETMTSAIVLDESGLQQFVGQHTKMTGEPMQHYTDNDFRSKISSMNRDSRCPKEGKEWVTEDLMLVDNRSIDDSLNLSNNCSVGNTKSSIEASPDGRSSPQSSSLTSPIAQTMLGSNELISVYEKHQDTTSYSGSKTHVLSQEKAIMQAPPSKLIEQAINSSTDMLMLEQSKGTELQVFSSEQVNSSIQPTEQIVIADALDSSSHDDNERETKLRLIQDAESEGPVRSIGCNEEASETSSYLGSSDIPEDDSYWDASTVAYDDSTLGTSTLQEMISWVQSQQLGRDPQDCDVAFSFSESLSGAGSLDKMAHIRHWKSELIDDEQETNPDIDRTHSDYTVSSGMSTAKSGTSEENGYDQFAHNSTPLMEAFVFYVENTLEKMKGIRRRKRQPTSRMKARIDDNLSKISEGFVHSFEGIMQNDDNKPNDCSGGGGGPTSKEADTWYRRKVATKDDWNDLVEAPSDDMMRAAFGLITTTLTDEMADFVPSKVMKTSKKVG